jgi:hypothetical protein
MTFLEAIQADWIFYVVNLLAFGVVIWCTWLYSQSKNAEALAKVQAQLQQVQLQQNDKLFALEDALGKKKERIRLILKEIETQMRAKDAEMLKARRNELSNVFVMEYAVAMQQYSRLADQFYELHPPKYREFVRNYIFPFLDMSRKVLSTINAPKVIKAIGAGEAPTVAYSYKDFDFAFDMIRKHGNADFKREMKQYLPELGFKNSDLD